MILPYRRHFLKPNRHFSYESTSETLVKMSQIEEIYLDFSLVFGLSKTICFEARAKVSDW